MRERVAIVFMTLNVMATIVLGGAVAYELSQRDDASALQPVTGAVAGQVYEQSAPSSAAGAVAPSGGAAPATPAPASSGSPAAAQPSGGSAPAAAPAASSAKPSAGAKPGAGAKPSPGGKGSAETKPATNESPQQGVSRGVITVGGIYDETGPLDATVERDTVRSYFNLVNARGGVNGYKFQLIDCDSKYDPSSAHQCSQKLISQGVLAIVGWLSVSGEQNETAYLTSQGVPIIGGLGVPAEYESPLSYPTTPSLVTAGTALGTRAGQVGLKSPGVIFLNANFVQPAINSFLAALKRQGITPVAVETVDATKADYTDIVLKFQTGGAQSVAAFLDPYSYARLFQAMERQNWKVPFLGAGLDKASANRQYTSGCGSACAIFGAHSSSPVLLYLDHQNHPAIAEYLNAVRTYYPRQYQALDAYTTYQWVAAKVFVEAVRRIGDAPVTRKSLVDSLNNLKNYDTGGITLPISYSAGGGHDPLKCFQWLRNSNGQWRTVSDWNCFG